MEGSENQGLVGKIIYKVALTIYEKRFILAIMLVAAIMLLIILYFVTDIWNIMKHKRYQSTKRLVKVRQKEPPRPMHNKIYTVEEPLVKQKVRNRNVQIDETQNEIIEEYTEQEQYEEEYHEEVEPEPEQQESTESIIEKIRARCNEDNISLTEWIVRAKQSGNVSGELLEELLSIVEDEEDYNDE